MVAEDGNAIGRPDRDVERCALFRGDPLLVFFVFMYSGSRRVVDG